MFKYKILRFYRDGWRVDVIARGLTMEEAIAHCNDPETSSRTATGDEARRRTEQYGPWFDGYEIDDLWEWLRRDDSEED